MRLRVVTKNITQTLALSKIIAREADAFRRTNRNHALVIGLTGGLGSGKTAFVQGFAKALGIREKVRSPSFLIIKRYIIPKQRGALFHIDCFRLKGHRELTALGFDEILQDPTHIVMIEWAERVRTFLPRQTLWVTFRNAPHRNWRCIMFHTAA